VSGSTSIRLPAPGWFCTMMLGWPDMVGKMARQEAGIGVVSRLDPDADHEPHRPAAIEGGNVLLCERRRAGRQQREGGEEGDGGFHHRLSLTSLHQPQWGHRNPSCMLPTFIAPPHALPRAFPAE
jgi:hypothetical protein